MSLYDIMRLHLIVTVMVFSDNFQKSDKYCNYGHKTLHYCNSSAKHCVYIIFNLAILMRNDYIDKQKELFCMVIVINIKLIMLDLYIAFFKNIANKYIAMT